MSLMKLDGHLKVCPFTQRFLVSYHLVNQSFKLHIFDTSNIGTPTLLINSTFVMETVVTQYIRSVFFGADRRYPMTLSMIVPTPKTSFEGKSDE